MTTRLVFRSSKNLRNLAKETLQRVDFLVPYSGGKTTKERSILIVKDEGIYLCSNFKTQRSPSEEGFVIYARGFNPSKNRECWDDARDAVGGDNFAERVPMTDEQLARVSRGGNVKIELSPTSMMVVA